MCLTRKTTALWTASTLYVAASAVRARAGARSAARSGARVFIGDSIRGDSIRAGSNAIDRHDSRADAARQGDGPGADETPPRDSLRLARQPFEGPDRIRGVP